MKGQISCPWCHGVGEYEMQGDAHRSAGTVPCLHTPPYFTSLPPRFDTTQPAPIARAAEPRDLWLAELRKQTALMEEQSGKLSLILDSSRASNILLIKIKSLSTATGLPQQTALLEKIAASTECTLIEVQSLAGNRR